MCLDGAVASCFSVKPLFPSEGDDALFRILGNIHNADIKHNLVTIFTEFQLSLSLTH